ncbi:MAG: OmpH family outer membrane protein [Pseudomonadota bacterium]
MLRRIWVAAAFALLLAQTGFAQQLLRGPIVTIDPERFYLDSAFGQSILTEVDSRNRALAAENRALEAQLEAEERELKELRPTLSPEDFRDLADAFDARVQAIRREREAEGRAISVMLDENRDQFLQAAQPVLEQIMRELGAAVVLDVNFVYASASAVDITDRAIAGVNAVLSQAPVTAPKE